MVNVFFQATFDYDGFSMVLEGPAIGFNGFSMVFEILRPMVNDGLHVPLHKKVRKINSRQNAKSPQ